MNKKLFFSILLSSALVGCGGDDDDSDLPSFDTPPNVGGTISIDGDAIEGDTLSADLFDANGLPETVTYTWSANGSAITGASSATYVLTAAEIGATITVTATYTDNDGYGETVTSSATDAVASNTVNVDGAVAIIGSPTVGRELTAEVTDSNGIVDVAITYSWLADGVAIAGASSATYTLTTDELGAQITVTAEYIDNDAFEEDLVSAATVAVSAAPVNVAGTVAISGDLVVGQELTAEVTDGNGTTTSTIAYQWSADGADIDGATSSTYTLTAAEVGVLVGVAVDYTDDDANDEVATISSAAVVVTTIVNSESTLIAALDAAADGDWIGVDAPAGTGGTDDYADMAQITVNTDNVVLLSLSDSAVFSGATCVHLDAAGATIDGLSFEDIDILVDSSCDSNGDSSVYVNGDAAVLRNSTFDGENRSIPDDDPYNWVSVKSVGGIVERNLFTDKGTGAEGAAITVFATDPDEVDADQSNGNLIRYNVFKDFGDAGADSGRNSGGYVLQIGRSTGDAGFDGNNTISYNLFSNVNMDRRIARVQSEFNTFDHNTVLDSSGQFAFEDGAGNIATNNIIINLDGDNNDDGGFAFSPYGHTISNNYMAGIRETSGDRGPLMFVSDYIANTYNSTIPVSLVTVANNTVLNSREPIEFASKDCDAGNQFIVDMDSNLIANGEDDGLEGAVAGLLSNGEGRTAIQNECAIDSTSDFDNNHIYSETFENGTANSFYADFAGASGNISGGEGEADVVANAANDGLFEGQGVDAGIGADVTQLELLDESMVGPGTTWVPGS